MLVQLESRSDSLYERVGGEPFFVQLVDRFYAGVEADPLLRPMYPDDLGPPRRHLTLFLMQYWGGPGTYSEERGHPRLRLRHVPFAIGLAQREAWLKHMLAAVDASPAEAADRQALRDYFNMAATSLLNRAG
jgi:hemoglobin